MAVVGNPFPRTLTERDLVSSATVNLVANQWIEVGRFVVDAGTAAQLGHGDTRGLDSAVGRLYMDLQSATGPVEGLIRLDVETPQQRVDETVVEYRTERLRAAVGGEKQPGNLTVQIPFPQQGPLIGENWSFVFRVRADEAATLSRSDSEIRVDMTLADVDR